MVDCYDPVHFDILRAWPDYPVIELSEFFSALSRSDLNVIAEEFVNHPDQYTKIGLIEMLVELHSEKEIQERIDFLCNFYEYNFESLRKIPKTPTEEESGLLYWQQMYQTQRELFV